MPLLEALACAPYPR